MKLLIFDTETTGLPKRREGAEKGPNNWPHLVSISWILLDTETNEHIRDRNYIIYPDGWEIPEESSKIHGITTKIARDNGYRLFDVMYEFMNEECDAWVAHNLEFDMGVIVNAVLWDLRIQFPKVPQKKFCTMLLGKSVCKLPWMYKGYKSPKLVELYVATFGKKPNELQLHNSMYDTQILCEIVKSNTELRSLMGLESAIVSNADAIQEGSTLRIKIDHAQGDYQSDTDMGK